MYSVGGRSLVQQENAQSVGIFPTEYLHYIRIILGCNLIKLTSRKYLNSTRH